MNQIMNALATTMISNIVNGHIRDMSGHIGNATGQRRDSEWTYWEQ